LVVAALITPTQCFLIMRATRFTGSRRERIAQLYQCLCARSVSVIRSV
jgi:hypothetical protein